ncbi:type II secretion system F family protein [Candidatus Micrarchaeota archaeon]|nr:type II secretion system F family protein [Candidatus Micrarchaeota archaeon]
MKKLVVQISKKFGKWLGNTFSKNTKEKIHKKLDMAQMNVSVEQYLSFVLVLSFLFTAYVGLMTFVIIKEVVWTFVVSLLTFLLCYLGLKYYPSFEAKRRGKLIEAELPTVLRMIGIQLDIKIRFEKIIKNIANEDYEVSKEFTIAHREIKSGIPIPVALQHMTDRVDSETFNRVVNQLIMNYEKGGRGDEIKQIAGQLTDLQTSELKAFESKMAFTGLIFIAVSCLMPAFFQIFISISSLFGSIILTPLHVWLLFVFVFPVISLISLIFINLSTPPSATLHKSSFDKDLIVIQRFMGDKKWIKVDDENDVAPIKRLFVKVSLFAALLFILFIIMGYYFSSAFYLLSFISLISPFMIYFYLLFLAENRIIKMEKSLPDALTHAAMLQKGMSTENIIKEIGRHKGPLGNEFKIAYRQISAGEDIEKALMDIAERNNSLLIERSVRLMIHGYYAGADMYTALRETAEDIYSLFNLISQRKSVLSLQKYTLLLGGAILVPLILGSIVQVVGSLNSEGLISLMAGGAHPVELLGTVKDATQVYLILFSIISGIMIAQQEGEPKKAIIYITLIAISSTILYNAALSYKII